MKIKKGDNVLIMSGKDKGRKGKVLRVLPQKEKVMVEGIAMRKKHVRAKRQGEKGQVVEQAGFIFVANVKLLCPKCGKASRFGYKIDGKNKYRVCKQCQGTI